MGQQLVWVRQGHPRQSPTMPSTDAEGDDVVQSVQAASLKYSERMIKLNDARRTSAISSKRPRTEVGGVSICRSAYLLIRGFKLTIDVVSFNTRADWLQKKKKMRKEESEIVFINKYIHINVHRSRYID